MASTLTTDTLRSLASFRAENGCAITLTVDLDPSTTPTTPDVKTKISSAIAQAEKLAESMDAGRDCRLALRADVERLREWLDNELDRDGARAIAVFASSADGLFRVLPLAEDVPDSVHVGPSLHIAPLVSALEREGDLVVAVSRERGAVYRFEGGRLREVADESEETEQHEGASSQPRDQRHADNVVHLHLKAVGAELDRQIHDRGLRIVVVASGEMRGDFESALSKEAREAVIGWATAEAHASPKELLEIVRPLLDEARAREEQQALEHFEEAHGRGERAATGWKQVLDAASDARVETLLVEAGADTRAWECPQCGRASADGGDCPLDGAKLEERDDAADLAMHQTLAHGGSIVRLGSGALGDSKGIAAILRY
jgi:rubrerythrin